ncbi:MAG: PQQ-binding-like beta-propeller repeat protein [Planctomycetota bacterium]
MSPIPIPIRLDIFPLLTVLVLAPFSLANDAAERAAAVSESAGIKRGLVVHVDCADGRLGRALARRGYDVVHGLETNPEVVTAARQAIHSEGLAGRVSVDTWDGKHLPYIDNLVTLLICEKSDGLSKKEIMRVVRPGGVAMVGEEKMVKAYPENIDQWSHYLYGPGNNAVSADEVVDQPFRMQWTGGPKWARHHDYFSSTSAMVSGDGRVFSIEDEGAIASLDKPSEWKLVARDAFCGLVLWKRDVGPWEGRFRRFRSGPPAIGRRLVASTDRIYVTLGYGKPVVALEAATGKTVWTCEETRGATEIILAGDTLYIAAENGQGENRGTPAPRTPTLPPEEMRIVAVDADSGAVRWTREGSDTRNYLATTLCSDAKRVFLHNTSWLVCLDAESGQTTWKVARPSSLKRRSWSAPTLTVVEGVLLSADVSADREATEPPKAVDWNYTSGPPRGPSGQGQLIAFSADAGEKLWECPTAMNYCAPPDIFVVEGTVWTGTDSGRNDPDFQEGRDLHTGEIVRRLRTEDAFTTTHHHRCYRDRATERQIIMGRTGIEFINFDGGASLRHCWIRGQCQYGLMPANGMLYLPPHSCACYIQSKLSGLWALASRRQTPYPTREESRLHKGPAFGTIDPSRSLSETDWPTYRHDPSRSGRIGARMNPTRREAWTAEVRGELTGLVAAHSRVLVASKDHHLVRALNSGSGELEWQFTAGGRIDSPPTIHGNAVLFGSADGYVYCLRLDDGALAWRFRAAPTDLRTVSYGQLESVWPVTGSVLVHDDRVYCSAGRSSFLDGGMTLYQLDPATGELLDEKNLYSRDPKTGRQPEQVIEDTELPGALPDVMVCDGQWIYLRDIRMDPSFEIKPPTVPHIYSSVGLLDGHWWHRTYWQWGKRTWGRYSGWHVVDDFRPSGRIMVADEKTVFGYGRKKVGPKDHNLENFHLFRADKAVEPVNKDVGKIKNNNNLALRKHQRPSRTRYHWSEQIQLVARAMVLSDHVLFAAGPLHAENGDEPVFDDQSHPSALMAFSTEDGSKLSQCQLPCQPVFDGMAAAGGNLYLSLIDGTVRCFEGGR